MAARTFGEEREVRDRLTLIDHPEAVRANPERSWLEHALFAQFDEQYFDQCDRQACSDGEKVLVELRVRIVRHGLGNCSLKAADRFDVA